MKAFLAYKASQIGTLLVSKKTLPNIAQPDVSTLLSLSLNDMKQT
jgi:hypothetical protein